MPKDESPAVTVAEPSEIAKPSKVGECLLTLLENPKFYKVLSGTLYQVQLPVDGLSSDEWEELKGPRFLNVHGLPKALDGVHHTALYGFTAAIPEISPHHHRPPIYLNWNPESGNASANAGAVELREVNRVIEARLENQAENIRIITQAMSALESTFTEVYHAQLTPSLEAIARIRMYLALRYRGEVDDATVEAIVDEINTYGEFDDASAHLPYIGLEVELPYMGNTDPYAPECNFVAFMEYLPLLNKLGIPTETDKQGEVALPKSKSPELQLHLLRLMSEVGYLPVDPYGESTPKYTLHINIGLPKESDFDPKVIPMDNKRNNELQMLGTVIGILYSNRERIKNGAYWNPASAKGYHEGEFRIEFRSLGYNPNEPEGVALQRLEDIRNIALPATHAYSTNKKIPELVELYSQWINECTNLCNEADPELKQSDYVSRFRNTMLTMLDKPEYVAQLATATQSYLAKVKILIQTYKPELMEMEM